MQATLTPTIPAATPGLLGSPAGELVLKICGGEHDGRTLRLTSAKCTIGSAPGCTLRLRARGIRPVHALILRGPAGCLIRCWTPDTQWNERGFTEAVLEIGDKVQIGPVTLCVAELSQPGPERREIQRTNLVDQMSGQPPRRDNRRRRKQLFGYLREERRQHDQLQSTISEQREQLSAFEQQIDHLQNAIGATAGHENEARRSFEQNIPAVRPNDDCLNQQLARTIEQLRQELDDAAKRRAMEQQSFARQRAAIEMQAEQRLQAEVSQLREQLQTEQQKSQQLATDSAAVAELKQQVATLQMQRESLQHEIVLLQTAFEAKAKGEEQQRQAAASQIEQLSHAYELVRQERDELFERLHSEQQSFDGQATSLQFQVEEARRIAQAQIAEVRTAAQVQISQLRAEFAQREQQFDDELIARTSSEGLRSAADAERIHKLSAELEALRAEVKASTSGKEQQQEGFTQARKKLEAEIANLNIRLKQSEQAVHDARVNTGELQAAVLAEAEQARNQRDSVREQMLRQQQDWTEFRSRLESAANEERELARTRYATLEAELATCVQQRIAAQTECAALHDRLNQLQIELEQTQEALFAAEHGANQRLQQMTVSMENLQFQASSQPAQFEQERADWERERDALARCVAELQLEVSRLSEQLATQQQQADSASQAEAAAVDAQLQQQLSQWQAAAEEARLQAAELTQAVSKYRQQEQLWQIEREQLDHQQQSANERLQQLETSITELQQQLDEAQRCVAVTCPQTPAPAPVSAPPADFGSTININNQDLAALCEQMNEPAADFGSTINVNNQDLAALREQMNEPTPSLLAPRPVVALDLNLSAVLQAREEALQSQAEELAAQQSQLEEEQAIVARQRIELESFHASLLELERSLEERAEAILHPVAPLDVNASYVSPDFHDYGAGPERESNPLSESEAFAAMADQVAALYSPAVEAAPALIHGPEDIVEPTYDSPATFSSAVEEAPAAAVEEEPVAESQIIGSAPVAEASDYPAELTTPENAAACNSDSIAEPTAEIVSPVDTPVADDDFDRQLEARMARVMRRERTDWSVPPTAEDSAAESAGEPAGETEAPSQSQAVNSVLERLKEAGLWKGEGTAKADQLPSSAPPIDDHGPALCRVSQAGPIGTELAEQPTGDEAPATEAEDELSLLAHSTPAKPSLLSTPAKDDESDDSIESYMSRLMQRLKTTSPEDENPRKTNGSSALRTSSSTAAKAAAVAAAPPKLTDSTPLTSLSELAPRSQAPELSANLAAMRELANSAARGAIETHRRGSKQQHVNMRTINTLMALLVAAGFTFMWSRTGSFLALGGIGLSLAWAIGSSLVAALQSLALRKAKPSAEVDSGEEPAKQ